MFPSAIHISWLQSILSINPHSLPALLSREASGFGTQMFVLSPHPWKAGQYVEAQPNKGGLSGIPLGDLGWCWWQRPWEVPGWRWGCMEGLAPARCLFVQIHTTSTPQDPKSCHLSRCSPATLIVIIAPGAVILNFPAFLPAPIFLFSPLCSSLCLDGCGKCSVPLSCDFREILLDVQKQWCWGFCSLSFFWRVCISLHAALLAVHRLGSSRDRKEYCFGLQTLCNVTSSLCNTFKI